MACDGFSGVLINTSVDELGTYITRLLPTFFIFQKKKESAKHKDCKRMLHSFIDVVKIRVFMIKSKLIPFVLQVLVALIELMGLCTEKDCSRLANEYLCTKLYSPYKKKVCTRAISSKQATPVSRMGDLQRASNSRSPAHVQSPASSLGVQLAAQNNSFSNAIPLRQICDM